MNSPEKTLFQKIADHEIPADIIYEDEDHIAFLDIKPASKGHLLVVPRKPYTWIQDMPEDEYLELFKLARKIVPKLLTVTKADLICFLIEGIQVPHVHLHLIPNYKTKDTVHLDHTPYNNESEKNQYKNSLIKHLK